MRRRYLLSGPVLLGFSPLFDAAWGRPTTEPLPVVAPACIGGMLAPFPCPYCGAVRAQAVDPQRRDAYRDPWRGFSWCPACRGRYHLDAAGTPCGAVPARVRLGGNSHISVASDDLDMLEAE